MRNFRHESGHVDIRQKFSADRTRLNKKSFKVATFVEMVRGYRGRPCSRGTSLTLNASYLLSLYSFVEDVKKLVEELSFIMPGAIDKS